MSEENINRLYLTKLPESRMDGYLVGIWQILEDSGRFLQDNHFSSRFLQGNQFSAILLQYKIFLPGSCKITNFCQINKR